MATCCLKVFLLSLAMLGKCSSTVLSLKYLLVDWFTLLQSIPKSQKSYFKFDSKVNFKFPMREKQQFTSWVLMSAHRLAECVCKHTEGCTWGLWAPSPSTFPLNSLDYSPLVWWNVPDLNYQFILQKERGWTSHVITLQRSKDGSACSLLSCSMLFRTALTLIINTCCLGVLSNTTSKLNSEQREEDAGEILFKEGLCTSSATLISQLISDTMFVLCDFSDPSRLRCLPAFQWWEQASPGWAWSIWLRGGGRAREEQSHLSHLPLGTKNKRTLCAWEAYL